MLQISWKVNSSKSELLQFPFRVRLGKETGPKGERGAGRGKEDGKKEEKAKGCQAGERKV